jgi:hypothetical protein
MTEQTRTGACLCKNITFRVESEELNFAICHCTNCRRNCGATYTANVWFPDTVLPYTFSRRCPDHRSELEQLQWSSGEELLKQNDDRDTETGEVVHRSFCTDCMWKPSCEQWRQSKVCFVDPTRTVKDDSCYNQHPDLKEFENIWAKHGSRSAQEFVDR